MLIGAPYANPLSRTRAGEAYILFGRTGSWPAILDLNTTSSSFGTLLIGKPTGDLTGYAVSDLGDVNGDGMVDLLIGSLAASPLSRLQAGEVYILFGRNGSWPGIFDLNNINVSTGVILQGRVGYDWAGTSVKGLGDVNGDGLVDFLVGANGASPLNRTQAGEAYIIFGRNSSWPDVLDLNNLNANTGVILQGRSANDRLGSLVSALGDINGDGLGDLLVSAYRAEPLNRTEAYIIFGNNESWPAILDLNILNPSTGVILIGRGAGSLSGSALGDVNGDEIPDILLGTNSASPLNRLFAGEAYILYGRAGVWPAILDLSTLNASTGIIFQGRVAGDVAGVSVSALGDVNGDGIVDMIVGAFNASPFNRTSAGEAYIIFGQRSLVPTTTTATTSTVTSSSIPMPGPIPAPFPIPAPTLIVTSSPVVGPVSTFMSPTSASSPTTSISETAPNDNKALYIGIGIGVGALAVAAATAIGIFAVKRKHTSGKKEEESIEMNSQEEIHLPVRASIQAGI